MQSLMDPANFEKIIDSLLSGELNSATAGVIADDLMQRIGSTLKSKTPDIANVMKLMETLPSITPLIDLNKMKEMGTSLKNLLSSNKLDPNTNEANPEEDPITQGAKNAQKIVEMLAQMMVSMLSSSSFDKGAELAKVIATALSPERLNDTQESDLFGDQFKRELRYLSQSRSEPSVSLKVEDGSQQTTTESVGTRQNKAKPKSSRKSRSTSSETSDFWTAQRSIVTDLGLSQTSRTTSSVHAG